MRFNVEARRRYLAFATSQAARWHGNFRELGASLTRLATLASAGRITESDVADEIARLTATWADAPAADASAQALGELAEQLDLFERCQLNTVIDTCRNSPSLSEAGRRLFAISRAGKKQSNDADRLRKYLARFALDFETLKSGARR